MRILFVTSRPFLPQHISAQNRTVLELCRRLQSMGHEPVVLSAYTGSETHGGVVQERSYGFRLLRAADPMRALPVAGAALRPQAMIVFDGAYEQLAAAGLSLRLPTLIWLFEVEPHLFHDSGPDPDLRFLATSAFLARRAQYLAGIEAGLLPPYIEHENYRVPRHGRQIVFVNPVREKGVEMMFRLAECRPLITFTVVESWELSPAWRDSCFERALRCGNIQWIPKSMNMDSIYQDARLLLVPRYSEEGFCRLVTEAQAGGVPVLASDRGNLPENVGGGGTLLSIDDELDVWLEHVDAYTSDDTLQTAISQRAFEHSARPELAGDRVVDRLLEEIGEQVPNVNSQTFSRLNG